MAQRACDGRAGCGKSKSRSRSKSRSKRKGKGKSRSKRKSKGKSRGRSGRKGGAAAGYRMAEYRVHLGAAHSFRGSTAVHRGTTGHDLFATVRQRASDRDADGTGVLVGLVRGGELLRDDESTRRRVWGRVRAGKGEPVEIHFFNPYADRAELRLTAPAWLMARAALELPPAVVVAAPVVEVVRVAPCAAAAERHSRALRRSATAAAAYGSPEPGGGALERGCAGCGGALERSCAGCGGALERGCAGCGGALERGGLRAASVVDGH